MRLRSKRNTNRM